MSSSWWVLMGPEHLVLFVDALIASACLLLIGHLVWSFRRQATTLADLDALLNSRTHRPSPVAIGESTPADSSAARIAIASLRHRQSPADTLLAAEINLRNQYPQHILLKNGIPALALFAGFLLPYLVLAAFVEMPFLALESAHVTIPLNVALQDLPRVIRHVTGGSGIAALFTAWATWFHHHYLSAGVLRERIMERLRSHLDAQTRPSPGGP